MPLSESPTATGDNFFLNFESIQTTTELIEFKFVGDTHPSYSDGSSSESMDGISLHSNEQDSQLNSEDLNREDLDDYEDLNLVPDDWEEIDMQDDHTHVNGEPSGLFVGGKEIITVPKLETGISPSTPLFNGSQHSLKDLARYFIAMKLSIGIGDRAFSTIVGSVLSFLPHCGDSIHSVLPTQPTVYKIMQFMETFSEFNTPIRTLVFHTCKTGCAIFQEDDEVCKDCSGYRWKHCNKECYDEEGNRVCNHSYIPTRLFYYMPIRDRVSALLNSDLKNLIFYEKYRKTSCKVY